MLKNAIAPMQAWLLSQGRCVGCGTLLAKGTTKKNPKGEQVSCKCGRIYLKDNKSHYRRALVKEVK